MPPQGRRLNVRADEAVLISPSHGRIWRSRFQVRAHIYKESANRLSSVARILAPGCRSRAVIASRCGNAQTLILLVGGGERGIRTLDTA